MIGRLGLPLAFLLAGLTAGTSAAPGTAQAPGTAHQPAACTQGVQSGTAGHPEFFAVHGQPPKLGARARAGTAAAPPPATAARLAGGELTWRLVGAGTIAARATGPARSAFTWWGRAPPHGHV
jgi:hypothetical protein